MLFRSPYQTCTVKSPINNAQWTGYLNRSMLASNRLSNTSSMEQERWHELRRQYNRSRCMCRCCNCGTDSCQFCFATWPVGKWSTLHPPASRLQPSGHIDHLASYLPLGTCATDRVQRNAMRCDINKVHFIPVDSMGKPEETAVFTCTRTNVGAC